MKLVADPIYVPNDADWQTIEDAKARAKWHPIKSREELMAETKLDNKCGSCKHFCLFDGTEVMGRCEFKCSLDYRQRSTPKCKQYERRDEHA